MMRCYFISTIVLLGIGFGTVKAEDVSNKIKSLRIEISRLKTRQESQNVEIKALSTKGDKAEARISELQSANEGLTARVDSLQDECRKLNGKQSADKAELVDSINQTNKKVLTTEDTISSRTQWGIGGLVVLLMAIVAVVLGFLKKFRSGTTSIDNVRKAQEALQKAQNKMQEESVKLDNQLLAIVQKQLDVANFSTSKASGEPDHSLVVKLADEIARIETNLSKMDKTVRGYKQLVQAKDRMINNVRANGYEIISLLGQEYNDGMQFQTRFVPDENLPEGKRVITGMIKMQVNYNGKMIQPAEIVVSQNI